MKNEAPAGKNGKPEISQVMHELANYISKTAKRPL
ncbi:MAG: hypothetical protein JWO70_3130, partial [Betaproteobacteria bacterium]|nr:hypothetical protein [Betaproteobacteria bacterium]